MTPCCTDSRTVPDHAHAARLIGHAMLDAAAYRCEVSAVLIQRPWLRRTLKHSHRHHAEPALRHMHTTLYTLLYLTPCLAAAVAQGGRECSNGSAAADV